MIHIRKAYITDEAQIYQLITVLEESNIDEVKFSKVFQDNLSNPNVEYYVYEKEDRILGFVSIHIQQLLHHVAKIAEIQELIVAEEARNSGIGSQLFHKAKEISKEENCLQLEVCCNQKRKGSHKFYEVQGMTNHHYKFCLEL